MRKCLIPITVAISLAVPVVAQPAGFSGTWKLNLPASFMGGDHPAPDYQLTKVLLQEGPAIHQTDIAVHVSVVNIPLPDSRATMDLIPDGQEHDAQVAAPFPGMPPSHLKVTTEWQGNTLVVTEQSAGTGRPSSTRRRYFLSNDGANLIELIEAHNSFGDSEQRLVFNK